MWDEFLADNELTSNRIMLAVTKVTESLPSLSEASEFPAYRVFL